MRKGKKVFEFHNYGTAIRVPYKGGILFVGKGMTGTVDDEKVAERLKHIGRVSITEKYVDKDGKEIKQATKKSTNKKTVRNPRAKSKTKKAVAKRVTKKTKKSTNKN